MNDGHDSIQLYGLLRQQIEHEDGLMTQRLSWLVASQSFLFTAYAIVLNAPEHAASPMHAHQQLYLLRSIPSVAICTDALIYVSLIAGVLALRLLRKHWRAQDAVSLPPLQGVPACRLLGLAPPMLLPLVFLVVWIFLLTQSSAASP